MIKPLHTLTRAEIRELAQSAADRGDSLIESNPFQTGTKNSISFDHAFIERVLELPEPEHA